MSTTSQDKTAVHLDIVVAVPVEHAFRVFTENFDEIKPREHNLLSVPVERTVLEARVGGTAYDIGTDGSRCTWGRVLACEPPNRLVFSWDISPRWQIETDPARTSEVEVTFTAEAPERTRVVLEHRHLDRHGDGWQGFLTLETGAGWPLYLQRYSAAVDRHGA
ncbi:SRPBCC family protein [Labedaea rhizosphaerae]|uniref:Uncharacterized protein YndB with AHSA1/START domain n=1 Tax=Labedaea rhizosphaerae TaxID=598644 RepID=A0A4R6RZV5_LABRH|nr:SRPBCC family protein [Labedaea rhizosphaerae]TDP91855.1 uncharacterized protein YndB with AHSA1/START domain [Labedaea rhizosphaerae]